MNTASITKAVYVSEYLFQFSYSKFKLKCFLFFLCWFLFTICQLLFEFRSFREYSLEILLLFSFWTISGVMRSFIHPTHHCWFRIPLIQRRHVIMHIQIEVFGFKEHSTTTRRLQCHTAADQTFYICAMWLGCKNPCKCNFEVRQLFGLDKPLGSFPK